MGKFSRSENFRKIFAKGKNFGRKIGPKRADFYVQKILTDFLGAKIQRILVNPSQDFEGSWRPFSPAGEKGAGKLQRLWGASQAAFGCQARFRGRAEHLTAGTFPF